MTMNSLYTHRTSLLRPSRFLCLSSVVGVDVCLIFILSALLEAFLRGPVLVPLAALGGAGGGSRLVAVAGSTKRHP